MKIKVFVQRTDKIEGSVNEWLSQQPEETERSIAMRNVQVGDVFRVYNHDDIEPIYIMVGVRYDHKALSKSFSTSEYVMMPRYSAMPIYYAVALNGNDAGLISVDGFSNADSRCISAASLIDEIFDTWKHVEKVNFQGVDEGRIN